MKKLSTRRIDFERDIRRFGLQDLPKNEQKTMARQMRFDEAAGRPNRYRKLTPQARAELDNIMQSAVNKRPGIVGAGLNVFKEKKSPLTPLPSKPEIAFHGKDYVTGGPEMTLHLTGKGTAPQLNAPDLAPQPTHSNPSKRLFKDTPGVNPRAQELHKTKPKTPRALKKQVHDLTALVGHTHPGDIENILAKKDLGSMSEFSEHSRASAEYTLKGRPESIDKAHRVAMTRAGKHRLKELRKKQGPIAAMKDMMQGSPIDYINEHDRFKLPKHMAGPHLSGGDTKALMNAHIKARRPVDHYIYAPDHGTHSITTVYEAPHPSKQDILKDLPPDIRNSQKRNFGYKTRIFRAENPNWVPSSPGMEAPHTPPPKTPISSPSNNKLFTNSLERRVVKGLGYGALGVGALGVGAYYANKYLKNRKAKKD